MKTYIIDNISTDDIERYRERSVRALNGIRLLYNEPSIIVNKPTIYGKYLTIAKYIGLITENDKSAYNYFVPINTNLIFLLRLSEHDNKNPSLYDMHEQNGRPNRRQIICFSKGEIEPKNEEWNGSKHVVVPYGINALDNEESVISFLNSIVKLFYDGDSSFPKLPLVNNNNYGSPNDVVHAWSKTSDKITDNKQYTNMKTNNKNVVRLTESKLKQMVAESVRKVLKEWDSDDDYDAWHKALQRKWRAPYQDHYIKLKKKILHYAENAKEAIDEIETIIKTDNDLDFDAGDLYGAINLLMEWVKHLERLKKDMYNLSTYPDRYLKQTNS